MLVVKNAIDGRQVAQLPIGRGSDAVAFDPVRKRIFSSNGSAGTITALLEKDPDHYAQLGDIPTGPTARTMTIDPASGRLDVPIGEFEEPTPAGKRPRVKNSSLSLLFLDPAP